MIPNLTLEMAKLLDHILSSVKENEKSVQLPMPKNNDRNNYITAGNILESKGFGKFCVPNIFLVKPEGRSFIEGNSFVKMYNKNLEKENYEKNLYKLTEWQLKLLKCQPILIMLSVITTTISILSTIWSFIK